MARKHILGLDGLRAFAIIAITLYHIFPSGFSGGYFGVLLFFALTGFLLVISTEKKRSHNDFKIASYYLGRIKRIFPSLIFVVLFTIGFYTFFASDVVVAIRDEALSIFLGFNNWWQILQNMDYFTRITNASPFSHLWFLSIEMQFYLIWPLLYLLYLFIRKQKGPKKALTIFTIIAFIFSLVMPILSLLSFSETRLYYGTDTRIFTLLWGVCLGFLFVENKGKFHSFSNVGSMVIFSFSTLLFIFCFFFLDGQNVLVYRVFMFLMTLVSLVMIYIVISSDFLGRILETPVLRWIGKNSFSIYLWQYPVIFFFQYLQLSTIPFYYILEIILILVLSVWMDFCLSWFDQKKRIKFLKSRRNLLLATSLISMCLMSTGIYKIIVSKETKSADQEVMKEKLSANKDKLEQSNNNSTVQEAETIDTTDYSSTDNSALVSLDNIAFVGDSVLLMASDAVSQTFTNCLIDAEVSRHLGQEQDTIKQWQTEGKIHETVVVAIGTNGVLYDFLVEELLSLIGSDHSIFWVNVYCPLTGWQDSNNEYLNTLHETHSNVTVIDWYSLISQHPEWLYDDGIHPNEEGSAAFANLIKESISDVVNQQKEVRDE